MPPDTSDISRKVAENCITNRKAAQAQCAPKGTVIRIIPTMDHGRVIVEFSDGKGGTYQEEVDYARHAP
jgi:hypothetical protein